MIQNSIDNTSVAIQHLEDQSPDLQNQQSDEQVHQSSEYNAINQPIDQLDQNSGQQVEALQQVEYFDPLDYEIVYCPYCDYGMIRKAYWIHVNLCEEQLSHPNLVEQECQQCREMIVRQYLNDHLEVCPFNFHAEVNCPYCNTLIIKAWLQEHLAECNGFQVQQLREIQGIANCQICQEDIIQDQSVLNCSHSFHEDCLQKWLKIKKTCPVCKSIQV
ncbi:unnamed protein product [Paramecium octaurelia]|uniref:RING-type domain-containing protein n=1 Tax=Paramecium octaurelia TaxID=43137 RepID=A0A8S1WDG6_PAROT|nr:unnamed protein product [Paramecium octaurelia]